MYFIQNVSHSLLQSPGQSIYCVLAFGYIKISFKPITSKTEIWTVFTALCLKKRKGKKTKQNTPSTPKGGKKKTPKNKNQTKPRHYEVWNPMFSSMGTKDHIL